MTPVTMTASASAATAAKLARVLAATAAKVAEERRILEEYHGQLEMVGPAPGQPWDQHEAMVSGGRSTFTGGRAKCKISNLVCFNCLFLRVPGGGRALQRGCAAHRG